MSFQDLSSEISAALGSNKDSDPAAAGGALSSLSAEIKAAIDAPQSKNQPAETKPAGGYISDIGPEIAKAASNNWDAIKKGLMPSGQGDRSPVQNFLDSGRGLAAVPGLIMSPVTGAVRSVGGHALADATHAAGTLINPEVAAKDDSEKMYQESADKAETAFSALAPGRKGLPDIKAPIVPAPAAPSSGPLGVTLSKGQETGDLAAIRPEQAAIRGQHGPGAESRAKAFLEQQGQQVSAAKDRIAQSFDQFGQTIADSPQEAAQIAQNSLQRAAEQRKAGVTEAYDVAKSLPGEIHAGAFEGIAQKIKGDLSLRDDPIIIDNKTTPFADKALKDIEETIDRLKIQNRADPFGQPNPENITGVSLKGVDQVRKRLSTFRSDAYSSGNAADGRAASALVKAFDDHVDGAVNGGLFKGDPRAVQAWNDARAAHADYSATFKASKNDPIGRVIEKVIGKSKEAAAIPNDVADFLYGSSGVNPSSLNVGVANRFKKILGEQSPEWAGIKQGLFKRLVEPGEGQTDFGAGKTAQRISKFMNADGKEMADAVFTPSERGLIRQYGDLHRALEVPQSGANWSNTATFVAPLLKKIASGIAYTIGAVIGNVIAPGTHGLGEVTGAFFAGKGAGIVNDIKNTRQITKQMPLATEAINKWQRALAAHAKANSPPSRIALSVATTNMARALKPLGVDLSGVLAGEGSPNAQAGPDQQK